MTPQNDREIEGMTEREMLILLNERQKTMQRDVEQLRNIVYGILAIPLTGFLGALVFMVWKAAA